MVASKVWRSTQGNGLFLEKDSGMACHGPLAALVHGNENLGDSGRLGLPHGLPDIRVLEM
jgi:hypothetical protein